VEALYRQLMTHGVQSAVSVW